MRLAPLSSFRAPAFRGGHALALTDFGELSQNRRRRSLDAHICLAPRVKLDGIDIDSNDVGVF